MDGALGRDPDIAVQSANQELANLASTPMRLLALEGDDQALDLGWQLVGVAHGAARAIRQRFDPAILVALEDLVAGLAGDPELPADLRHRFAIEQFRHKPQALIHYRTLLPRHKHLPHEAGKCYLCVRYALLPMSRAAQSLCVTQGLFRLWPVTDLCHHYPQPAEHIDDPRTGQDVQPRSARNAAPSPRFPTHPTPAGHVRACLAARASSPRCAGDHASGNPRFPPSPAPYTKLSYSPGGPAYP